jgi:hypothetical protein
MPLIVPDVIVRPQRLSIVWYRRGIVIVALMCITLLQSWTLLAY